MNNVKFIKSHNKWRYYKNKNKRYFDNKIDVICYKFIMDLRYKTYWNVYRITE